jgi:hypothetical protein
MLLVIRAILQTLAETPAANTANPTSQINGVLSGIIGVMTGIGALVCAIGIAIGGLMRATSFGNERKISDSNTAITCAVVGLVIVLLAQTLGTWVESLVSSGTGTGH